MCSFGPIQRRYPGVFLELFKLNTSFCLTHHQILQKINQNLLHSCPHTMVEDEGANEGNVCDALFHIFVCARNEASSLGK